MNTEKPHTPQLVQLVIKQDAVPVLQQEGLVAKGRGKDLDSDDNST